MMLNYNNSYYQYKIFLKNSENLSDNNLNNYVDEVIIFLKWVGDYYAETNKLINTIVITEYRKYLHQQNLSPATVERKIARLKKYFDWAISQKLIVNNPFAKVKTFGINLGDNLEKKNVSIAQNIINHHNFNYTGLLVALFLLIVVVIINPWQRLQPEVNLTKIEKVNVSSDYIPVNNVAGDMYWEELIEYNDQLHNYLTRLYAPDQFNQELIIYDDEW